MRSLVMSINLLMNAFSSALAQAFNPLSLDPWLVWNYGIVAILAGIGGVGFWFNFHHLDAEEDRLNMLQTSAYRGKKGKDDSMSGSATHEPTEPAEQVVETSKV